MEEIKLQPFKETKEEIKHSVTVFLDHPAKLKIFSGYLNYNPGDDTIAKASAKALASNH